MAMEIGTSLDGSMEEVSVVLPEQELLNWAEPVDDGPAVFSNILEVFTGCFFWHGFLVGGWGESVVYWNIIFITSYLSW